MRRLLRNIANSKMKTEYRLAEALKNMMSEVPLDNISVTALVKKCHVNRQTFYYHFHDIYDLLTLVFLNESIPQADEAKTIKELLGYIYEYYSKNRSFVDATLDSAGKDLFEEFIHNVCYKTVLRLVNAVPDAKKVHINDRKSIVRFYASAYSHSIIYYLANYKNKSLDGLLNCFSFESSGVFEEAIQKLLLRRNKLK